MKINLTSVVLTFILIFYLADGYAAKLDLSQIPDSVPGDSFANKDKNVMIQLYGRALITSRDDYKCNEPKVIKTKVTKFKPIDSTNDIAEITEQWDINACGKHVGLFFAIVISEELPDGILIETAHGVKEDSGLLENDSDSQIEYSKLIIGKWGNSNDGGITFWSYDEYTSNKKIYSYGVVPGSETKFDIVSSYEIKDSRSCATIKETSHPDIMPIGHITCAEIKDINENKIIFEADDGEMVILHKVKE